MNAGAPWPVRISPAGGVGVACGTVLWRAGGQTRVTAIVKARFALVPERPMAPIEPEPLVLSDAHHGGDRRYSLRAACEIAPYLAQAEVSLTGHAYAPPGRPTPVGGVRLVVRRGGSTLLDKRLDIEGDQRPDASGQPGPPAPFQHMPLVYARALGHRMMNPVGLDPARGRAANLRHATARDRPGCFAPVARSWPERLVLLRGVNPASLEGTRITIPDGLDWAYFQAAPGDQRIDFLSGDEQLTLGGMHPALPTLRTTLPSARGVARIYGSPG
ncbi:MAG: DUF2169 domain-containing protein, partial [Polyangiaceae bacterium]|nr:DUF2169 domain-containing protein [Polyangiaceae bacterium]